MLPYNTTSSAEEALCRSLTSAEALWLSYSADKSDYLLYCHSILVLFTVSTLCSLLVVLVILARSSKLDRYKIQPGVELSFPEMLSCHVASIKSFFLVVGSVQLVSYPIAKMTGIRMGLPLPSMWEILAQLAVYFVVEGCATYWIHRCLHSKWGYEMIHRVHHEYTSPILFVAAYAHWAEILILGSPTLIAPAMVPCHLVTLWIWIALRQIVVIETHSGYDFPWMPMKFIPFYGGAAYHDYHHLVGGLTHSNFASIFTYCDYIYGTNKGFQYKEKLFAKMKQEQSNGGPRRYVSSHDLKSE